MKYIFPYVFVLVYWIIFYTFINFPGFTLAALLVLIGWVTFSFFLISGKNFYRNWNTWLSILIFHLSSFSLILILSSSTVRNFHVFFLGILGGIAQYAILRFLDDPNKFVASNFLNFINFLYVIAFWQAIVFLYFLQISYGASRWQAGIIAACVTYLLSRGIIATHGLKKSSSTLVLLVQTLTTAEFIFAMKLLPVHFYILATAVACWFYYIIEIVLTGQELHSRNRIFKYFTVLFIIALSAIFLTARWQ